MQWKFGGNVIPFIRACENNWMECPHALVNYIWTEVVSDVTDCLVNEAIVWRILAVLLFFTIVIDLIYWKICWMKEIAKNKEMLKKVNFKVKSLELKINILTYKVQYDTSALEHNAKKTGKNNFENTRSILPKKNEEISWVKHLCGRFFSAIFMP